MTFADRVLALVVKMPGITDRELTNRLLSTSTHPSQANQTCRQLEAKGMLHRALRPDGKIGNYRSNSRLPPIVGPNSAKKGLDAGLSEDEVKAALETWLLADGWEVEIAWGKVRGIDIHAKRANERWIIEAKGSGSLSAMRVNYFLAVIGETMQRMDDPSARYSIALPDMKQFRGLWDRLPVLAKERMQLSAIFVGDDGAIEEIGN